MNHDLRDVEVLYGRGTQHLPLNPSHLRFVSSTGEAIPATAATIRITPRSVEILEIERAGDEANNVPPFPPNAFTRRYGPPSDTGDEFDRQWAAALRQAGLQALAIIGALITAATLVLIAAVAL